MAVCAGIKKIVYADPSVVTAALTAATAKTVIQAAISAGNTVDNVHGETWTLDEAESAPTGYKNQLNGKNYRYDRPTEGDITPSFTIGQYDYALKKAFMGGDVIEGSDSKPVGWSRPDVKETINKALFCLTDDGVWFIFPKCYIDAHEANTDKAVAISVKAYVLQPDVTGVASEYDLDESAVGALTTSGTGTGA
ncbi:MAG TPA: hypothetical protein DCS83_03225 [Prevotella sp.]|nr:hypothetical protein [uncultured Prevotella sp.]HAT61550.1 hypothetical protein [Prevotella sp.]